MATDRLEAPPKSKEQKPIWFSLEFTPTIKLLLAYAYRVNPDPCNFPGRFVSQDALDEIGLNFNTQFDACCIAGIIHEWAELKKKKLQP